MIQVNQSDLCLRNPNESIFKAPSASLTYLLWYRYETAKSMLAENNYIVTEEEAMDILDATHIENEDLHGFLCSTLWSIVYNNTDITFDICSMYDFENVYKFSVNEPTKILNK